MADDGAGERPPPGYEWRDEIIAGVRVRFVYNKRTRNVEPRPNPDDLADASALQVLRLWHLVGVWARKVVAETPWKVDGQRAPDLHTLPDALAEEPYDCGDTRPDD